MVRLEAPIIPGMDDIKQKAMDRSLKLKLPYAGAVTPVEGSEAVRRIAASKQDS